MSAKDQLLSDAIEVAMRKSYICIIQRRVIWCLIIVIIGLIGGYFFI